LQLRPSFTDILARLKTIKEVGKNKENGQGAAQPACCTIA
jgi:hypothetical protein